MTTTYGPAAEDPLFAPIVIGIAIGVILGVIFFLLVEALR